MFFIKNMLFKSKPKFNKPNATESSSFTFATEMAQMNIQLQETFRMLPDFVSRELTNKVTFGVYYLSNLVDSELLNKEILNRLIEIEELLSPEKLVDLLPIGQLLLDDNWNHMQQYILQGWTYIHISGYKYGILVNTAKQRERALTKPENESQILGPQIAFTENLETNLALIHQYLPNPDLSEIAINMGENTQNNIRVVYLRNRADLEMVTHILNTIQALDLESLLDATVLAQWMEDNPNSAFPQTITTERVDRAIFPLLEGKVVIVVSGSPNVIICPTTFLDFFKSIEDYYYRWTVGLFLRGLRVLGIMISLFATAVYVAALTFHYETIPQAFLVPLAQSRARVPFPPLIEALMLETIIQLLGEAGARLPSKVGQTMGIVGGIVIGQAAVQAGFTSNILIIIVALSALSSFTTPVFAMSNTIRIIRFSIIISAGIIGGLGITMSIAFLILHLLRQSSVGQPYFYPPYTIENKNKRDGLVRMPFSSAPKRSVFANTEENNPKGSSDIDE
ncbi:spore germination protein (plasmid) [Paenibacillus rhizovicinus]|uniref:Spore germination protein n=1 Tax=Paenibacillus rhizovicinus TaxID=2704463 RepID=A0A6C0PAX2_9BACL|nr:spore germination protein [Paenibacillus rhizovicinus]QHW35586.1 spore germination protein [Paenibacillus rhizovicinus]